MYILLTDETNRKPSSKVKFFVYGGLIIPLEHLLELDTRIAEIRAKTGYRPGDLLKFDTHSRGDDVTVDAATEAKRRVIALCNELGCSFIVHVILHDIIAKQDPKQQVQWAADFVISRFNMFLESTDDYGLCIIDNLPEPGQFQYLADKFHFGLHGFPDGDRPLERIKLFGTTCVGASHAGSAMDIVLGTFRYCINDPSNEDAATEMLQSLVPMLWSQVIDGKKVYEDLGVIFRPKLVDVRNNYPTFRRHYDELVQQINRLAEGSGS